MLSHRLCLPAAFACTLAFGVACRAPLAHAAWPPDNTLLTADVLSRSDLNAAPDGVGGMFVVWVEDYRGSQDLYAQHFDSSGLPAWDITGVTICAASGDQTAPVIVADGSGGAVVAWQDARTGNADVYTQRISSGGVTQWTFNGVQLVALASDQVAPDLVSDGSGGAIVAWQDARNATVDIYARRISSAGVVQWSTNGVALCTAAGEQSAPRIVTDGSGGGIVGWRDLRGAAADVYARRVTSAGAPQWTVDGVALCTATGNQQELAIATDGLGGAIVAWRDFRGGATSDVYARRVSSAGVAQWTANGVAISTAGSDQAAPAIVADGAGGAVMAWQDHRGSSFDIYVQRVSSAGAVAWTVSGVPLCALAGDQTGPALILDGAGGAIVGWRDARSGTGDVYARRVTLAGVPDWAANGIAVCSAAGDQAAPVIVPDALGGANLGWADPRDGGLEPYARHVDAAGNATGEIDGRELCILFPLQFPYGIAPDGSGGAIVAFEERFRSVWDIYAQRVDADGSIVWAPGGVALCTAAGNQLTPTATSDGSGGAIVAWTDPRFGPTDIYGQRVSAAGVPQWTADGIAFTQASGDQRDPVAVTDGAGGAIVAWDDLRVSMVDGEIYGQRVTGAGVRQWGINGNVICTAGGNQTRVRVTADGAGGAIAAWEDYRLGATADVYANHINGSGTGQWAMNGEPICTATGNQLTPVLTTDGAGGAIITWQDARAAGNQDIYAQRIAAGGVAQWTLNGVAACGVAGNQWEPSIVSDAAGGVVIAWTDNRAAPSSSDAYAQRLNSGGAAQWAAGGVALTTSGEVFTAPALAWNGTGVFAVWPDGRAGKPDIYAQRVLAAGSVAWTANGNCVAGQAGTQANVLMTSSGASSAILAWRDERISSDVDIYAHRLDSSGPLAAPGPARPLAAWLAPVAPNPVRAGAEFRYAIARAQPVRLAIFDLAGRRVRGLVDAVTPAGEYTARWDGRTDEGLALASGVYYVRLASGESSVSRAFVKMR